MPKNLGLYNDDLSTPRKQDVDACYGPNNAPPYPVTSVNGKTGGVNLTASDVGAVSTDNITQTLGTSTTKVPSEKAVSDAIVAAGGGGGSGESDVFYAIYGTTTNAEILAAYEAGKAVYMKKGGNKGVYPLILISGDSVAYFGCVIASLQFKRYKCWADAWSEDESVSLAKKPVSAAVTLSASGWNSSSKTQVVTVSGVLADETKQLITPSPAAASQVAYYNAGIRCTGQSANELTFTAKTVPTADLTVYVTIQEVGA